MAPSGLIISDKFAKINAQTCVTLLTLIDSIFYSFPGPVNIGHSYSLLVKSHLPQSELLDIISESS